MSVWNAKRLISDNALNLNNDMTSEVCSLFKINTMSPKMNSSMEAKKSKNKKTSTGAPHFPLVYGIEAVLPIEGDISSLRVLSELKLDEAEWIQARYDQLNLIEE